MTPLNPRKRFTPNLTEHDSRATDFTPERPSKRQRISEESKASYPPSSSGRPATLIIPPLITPPPSARPMAEKQTMILKLKIPKHKPDTKERREAAARKVAAYKWKKEGKLQRSLPDSGEIKRSYPLKLMRHYPAAAPSAAVETPAPNPAPAPVAPFIKPQIQKSARVTTLLKSFPAISIPPPAAITDVSRAIDHRELKHLKENKRNTATEQANRLAWKSFAKQDRPHREVMIESALPIEDLEKECCGQPNALPEWKKHKTSKFRENEKTVIDLTRD